MAFCTKCGAANPDNAPACSVCGNPMARRQFCPRCGSVIPAGMSSCPNCSGASAGTPSANGFQAAGDLGGAPMRAAAPAQSGYAGNPPAYGNPQPYYPTPAAPAYTPVPAPAPTYDPVPAAGYPDRGMPYAPADSYGGPPRFPLKSDRNWFVMLLLSAITCGIYGLIVMSQMANEVNMVCTPHDNRRSMHYALIVFVFSWLTLGIVPLVWYHNLCDRIGNELRRRGINYAFGAGTFWGWNILGVFILVGPFIFLHKFFTAVNLMNADYNQRG